jgi:N6-adenosine-specific RNA methylase IME4
MAPEHKRLSRYGTMTLDDIMALPVEQLTADTAHLYLWVPNALLPEGIKVLEAWGLLIQEQYRLAQGAQGRRGRMGAALASTSATSPSWCCSVSVARTPGRLHQVGGK